MVKERAHKKSFQQSLEDIKERMKEKRNKRLATASAPSIGRSRMMNKSSVVNSTHTMLKGVQLNNRTLALALQAEKEKVRQASAVILQQKREQQALFLHLLLLKRKLKEQEALAANAAQIKPQSNLVEPQRPVESPSRSQTCQNLEEAIKCKASTILEDPQSAEMRAQSECDKQALPSTVGVRRRHAGRSRRRSDRVAEKRSYGEEDPVVAVGALIASPVRSDSRNVDQQVAEPDCANHIDVEEFRHSTPEPALPKINNNQRASRKQAQQQQQHRTKPEPAARKPQRGRKQERAPLKKPWENSKPRTRSKSRDRSATRVKTAPPSQGNKLNTSLGFNDTFDFDCEEAVHVTPFRAKAEDDRPAPPISGETPQRDQSQMEASPVVSSQNESSSSSPSSDSEDCPYVPKTRRRQTLSDKTKAITTRRARSSKVVREKENVPPKQEISEESCLKAVEPEKEEGSPHQLPDCSFSNSPEPMRLAQENHQGFVESQQGQIEKDRLPLVSPLVEAEMMRIDDVLSNFGDSTTEATPQIPNQTPQRARIGKKRGLGVRTAGRGLSLCDVTNLSPAAYRNFSCGDSRPSDAVGSIRFPARKRRCTMVDYKEPSLNAKLRRGDKFTDLQFLSSPIFKQKSGRKSLEKSRSSMSSRQPFKKYNESFVGCR